MFSTDYVQFAEALVFVHGRKAEAEAAMHASLCEKTGDMETAETWRRVQNTLRHSTKKAA
jgi:transcriptional regulator of met regulon